MLNMVTRTSSRVKEHYLLMEECFFYNIMNKETSNNEQKIKILYILLRLLIYKANCNWYVYVIV
jgi:hypothetical protein